MAPQCINATNAATNVTAIANATHVTAIANATADATTIWLLVTPRHFITNQ